MSGFSAPMPTMAPLVRMDTMGESDETDLERKARYLQYECSYNANTHKGWTWGDLVMKDYDHFAYLMGNHVPLGSTTYSTLRSELKIVDQTMTDKSVRFQDTEDGKRVQTEKYLDLVCTHKGRMGGKTWRDILNKDYDYFLWAVGNSMGRDTRTFNVFLQCLKPPDIKRVLETEKGKLVVASLSGRNVIKKAAA